MPALFTGQFPRRWYGEGAARAGIVYRTIPSPLAVKGAARACIILPDNSLSRWRERVRVRAIPRHQQRISPLTDFEHYYQRIRRQQKRDTLLWSLLLVALYIAAGNVAEFNLVTVWQSLPHFFDYIGATLPVLHLPLLFADVKTEGSLAYWGYRLHFQLPLIWETLQLALSSTLIAVLIAAVLAFFAADNTQTPRSLRMAIRAFVAFLRTMPELAWAVMFVMAFGIGAIPGFLALALHTIGSLTKLFYESIESASDKPVRGLAACGASKLQRMRFAFWPQVKPTFLSYSFMRLEINFRSSTILGLVGAGGIGQELMTNIKLDRYDQVSMTLLLIIVVVSLLDTLSGWLCRRVVEGDVK